MARKGCLVAGAVVALGIGGALLSSGREGSVGYEEGTCYYLVPGKDTGLEWRPVDCEYLEDLLEDYPDTAYVDADDVVHSSLDSTADGQSGEEADEDESCQNPYDEGLGVGEKIGRVACWYDLRPDLLHRLWEVESRKDHWEAGEGDGVKRSYAGAVGIAQVMPGHTGESMVDGHELDIYEEVDNMELGAQVLLAKCRSAVAIANANGFETRRQSEEEPCGAIHYMCAGTLGNAYPVMDEEDISFGTLLHDEWYTTPEEVMARAYNGVSCGGDLVSLLGWSRGRAASYWTMHYVEHVLSEAAISEHPFDDAP